MKRTLVKTNPATSGHSKSVVLKFLAGETLQENPQLEYTYYLNLKSLKLEEMVCNVGKMYLPTLQCNRKYILKNTFLFRCLLRSVNSGWPTISVRRSSLRNHALHDQSLCCGLRFFRQRGIVFESYLVNRHIMILRSFGLLKQVTPEE